MITGRPAAAQRISSPADGLITLTFSRAVPANRVQRVFGGVSAKQTFKRHHKTAAIIDETFRTFACPLFDTPMVENRRVKHSAILHAQMNCFTPLHKGFFDYFHIDSFRAAERIGSAAAA